jgi:hypothetical protein
MGLFFLVSPCLSRGAFDFRGVADVFRKQAFQMRFIRRDDVVEEVPPTALNPSLCDAVLPRAFKGSPDRLEIHRTDGDLSLETVFSVTIERQMSRPSARWNLGAGQPLLLAPDGELLSDGPTLLHIQNACSENLILAW